MALAGEETLLAAPDRNGLIQPTKLFERIREAACDIRPKLIVLDNAADIFGGNENDRAQVRQFIGMLRGMAIAAGAGVLLTSHPSLTGINHRHRPVWLNGVECQRALAAVFQTRQDRQGRRAGS